MLDLVQTPRLQEPELYPQLPGGLPCLLQEDTMNEVVGIGEDSHALDTWQHLCEQLEALAAQFRREETHAGHVPAGPGERGDQSRPDRFAHGNEDDGTEVVAAFAA